MFKLDNTLLEELGLGSLPADEKNKMLAHIYETLEMRVGMKLAEQMTNEQLDEFESFIDKNDEAGALKWLETNFPNYKQVVADQLELLKSEVKQAAPQIVAASQQNAAAAAAAMPPGSMPTQATAAQPSLNDMPRQTYYPPTSGPEPVSPPVNPGPSPQPPQPPAQTPLPPPTPQWPPAVDQQPPPA
ncbi:MAG: hypothetical protein JWS12_22 [Candidatus Saccharibacteria bacterium]|nr:hypothetical protein [Candidatus Saccharibacteria bacterium]